MERDADPMIGRVLDGRYRVGAKIARGGMATVFEATDLRLDRRCAVKIMHSDLGDDEAFRTRFVREAHAAARLSHPNVVSVSDQGDDQGALFLVMEHVRGRTLRDVMRHETPMPADRALALLEPVLMALAEAHANGLVHRDVKPENVLIADDGRVKVADFGLARAFDTNTTHTATRGVLIGTVSYLAPELIVDGKADPRADVYAAGVLLYEMLTGRKPHEGEGAIQIAFKHVNEDIAPPSAATGQPLPAFVDALVIRATARDRDRRQADAKVFLQQLRRVRGALAAGVEEDAELTADLLPNAQVVADDSIDYVDDTSPAVHAFGDGFDEESEETTTIINSAGSALASGVAAGVGAGVGAGVASAAHRRGSTSDRAPSAYAARNASPAPRWPGVPPQLGRLGSVTQETPPVKPRRRRSRRGLVLLVVVLLLTALAAYGGWWAAVGRYTSMPGIINQSVADATTKVEDAGLELDVAEKVFSETVPAGSVISTDPKAGERIVEGDTVDVSVSRGRERYKVPRLAGRDADEVEALLEDRNLTLGEVSKAYNETVDKGVVIFSTPRFATELRRDSVVGITVSRGQKPIKIPDFTGRHSQKATVRLGELGFTVSPTEENSETVAKGDVVSQSPDSGTGFKEDTIELVISKGPVMVAVPDLVGDSISEATSKLSALGLKVNVVETDLYIGLDRIVRQGDSEGSLVPKGGTVTVSVV